MFDDSKLEWQGDCFCDDKDSQYGINLNCEAYNFDDGDCDPNNNCEDSNTMQVDCDGQQFDAEYLAWVGDCICDGAESDSGLNFMCVRAKRSEHKEVDTS